MKKVIFLVCFFVAAFLFQAHKLLSGGGIYSTNAGTVNFTTKGPLGVIKAESKKLTGTLDAEKKSFSFAIPVSSFEGFQNQLQQKHYNEKYMESAKIPLATFKGKVIEDVNFSTPGTYPVRAKGIMNIHGVDKELIIKSKMTVKAGSIGINATFNVLLEDYNIKIPAIVSQQVDDNILVEVITTLNQANK